MGAKSVPLSVRLPQKDAEYIAGLKAGDAVTMSEKVRYLVGEARRLSDEGASFEGVVKHTNDVLAPLGRALDALEKNDGESSQLLRAFLQWLPGLLATLETVDFERLTTQIPDLKDQIKRISDKRLSER